MKQLSIFSAAWYTVFQEKRDYLFLFLTIIITFFILIAIPVIVTPGNDIFYQISIMPAVDLITLVSLSIIAGISFVFNLYIFQQKKHESKQVGNAIITFFSTLLSSFFGTVTCIACAATIGGFLGLTTVTFIVKNRIPFALLSIFLLFTSVYFTAQRVLHTCKQCVI